MSSRALLDKYLTRYAAFEARSSLELPRRYRRALVLPVLAEAPTFLRQIAPAFAGERGLVILVVNATDRARPDQHALNAELMRHLRERATARLALGHAPPIEWLELADFDMLVVDRASPGFRLPAKQGVGLARRIGADVALALHARGAMPCRGFGCTDADASLPPDYFACGEASLAHALAAIFPFEHAKSGDPELDRATQVYELSLRYYVLGLSYAGSPYAYQSLGSALYVSFEGYAKVRGFPMRQAGEDFYLLGKLAKLGQLARLARPHLTLQARVSERVPFGTGPSVARLVHEAREGREPTLYAPQSFEVLRQVLAGFSEYASSRNLQSFRERLMRGPDGVAVLGCLENLGWSRELPAAAAQASDRQQLERRLAIWFDALKTLRLIHCLKECCQPMQDWRAALAGAPFLAIPVTDLESALRLLRDRELGLPDHTGV